MHSRGPFEVLIAGGGVAALEAALALEALAGDRVHTTMLTPDPEFVYRPMTVREPFGYPVASRWSLETLARDIGFTLHADRLDWVDPGAQLVHTGTGELAYDALLVALGARRVPRYSHALTLDERRLDEQLHGLVEDVEGGWVKRIAFVVPSTVTWPLPLYEIALLIAGRAHDMNLQVTLSLVTPEAKPMLIFGEPASRAVTDALRRRGIRMIPSAHAEIRTPGRVSLPGRARDLEVDRVVALPELFGPSTPGIPTSAERGFLPIDRYGRVHGVPNVFAAGDATDGGVKQGGLAAIQADAAAEVIAALAGAPVSPRPIHPVICGMLLGDGAPIYLRAVAFGRVGTSSEVSREPLWQPPVKIQARYLAPYLETIETSEAPR